LVLLQVALCSGKGMEIKATSFETGSNGCITFFDGGKATGWICDCSMVALKNEAK
jgi:hypothetical protein